jgi:hypothetical protein
MRLHRTKYTQFVLLLFVSMLASIVGCDEGQTEKFYYPTYLFSADISAYVESVPSGDAVAGATCELYGVATDTTGTTGVAQFSEIPEGAYELHVSAPGHAGTRHTFTIQKNRDESTEYHHHAHIYLLEQSAELRATLVLPPGDRPASYAVIEFSNWRYPDNSYRQYLDMTDIPQVVTADSLGYIEVANLPATEVDITIHPYDRDADGTVEYRGGDQEIILLPAFTNHMTYEFTPYANAHTRVESTNIPPSNDPLTDCVAYWTFNSIMDTSRVEVTMTLSGTATREFIVEPRWTSEISMQINPCQPLAADPDQYRIDLAVWDDKGDLFTDTYNLYWELPEGCEPGTASGMSCTELISELRILEIESPVNFDTVYLTLEWDAAECVGGYNIYARDNRNNPTWTWLKYEPTDFDYGPIRNRITLPARFDRFYEDQLQTPFAGIAITFCVVPEYSTTPNPDDGHATITIVDEVAPGRINFYQQGASNYEIAAGLPLTIPVMFDDYIATSSGDPYLVAVDPPGEEFTALDPARAVWTWASGQHSGAFTYELLPGENITGSHIRVVLDEAVDLSGNSFDGPLSSNWLVIIDVGTLIEDNFEGPVTWLSDDQCWELGTPSIGPGGAYSGDNCWAVSLDANYDHNLSCHVDSPYFIVPRSNPLLQFQYWCDFGNDDYVRLSTLNPQGGEVGQAITFNNNRRSWTSYIWYLHQVQGQVVKLRFTFTSNASSNDDGFFFDDVQILGDK